MLNLDDLAQLVAFYQFGTLTKVAEEFHISQPTITRTMKRVEDAFGVPLFRRTANHIELNEAGIKAAEASERLLDEASQAILDVQEFERKLYTIHVISCAPAPLWTLLPELSRSNSDVTISSKLEDDPHQIEQDFRNGKCDVAILPYSIEGDGFTSEAYLEEHLSICVTPDHVLAKNKTVTTKQINGHNCLLASDIGFWNDLCKRTMPSSRFLVQTDEYAFQELIRASSLPFFITNLTDRSDALYTDRRIIPITDDCMNVTFYLHRWNK